MPNKPRLVHLLNVFCSGAIPHIVRDLQPFVGQHFDVNVLALQEVVQDKWLVDEFRDFGIRVHTLDCSRLNMPLAALRLRRCLDELQPAIIHAHAGRASMMAPLCGPKGVPVYVTYHNLAQGYSRVTRNFLRYTDRFLTGRTGVSSAVVESWQKLGVRSAQTLYNPVNVARHEVDSAQKQAIRHEFGVSDGELLLVNVGRLTRAKGQGVLLDAVYRLKQKLAVRFHVVVAGRGPDEAQLKQQAKRLGLEDTVRFAGFRNDVPALLAAADVFVFPSRWEGHPVAALEAMAAGTAVVASDINSNKELIARDELGMLVPVEDADSLAAGLMRVATDVDHRQRYASAGQAYVRDAFSPERIAGQYLELYKNSTKLFNDELG